MVSEFDSNDITRFGDKLTEGTFDAYDVEELSRNDLKGYTALMRRIINEATFLDSETKQQLLKDKTEKYYEERLEQKDKWTLLIAKSGGQIVGVLEASIEENIQARFGFVHWVCIDTVNQGKGIGPQLYQGYENILRNNNLNYMVAAIEDINEPSLKMHERFGFNMQSPFSEGKGKKWYYKEINPRPR